MNKYLVIIFTFVFCLIFSKTSFAATGFSDVPSDFWAYKQINFLLQKGIIDPGSQFNPNADIKREVVAKWLVKAKNINVNNLTVSNPFSDVKRSDPYYKYIMASYQAGIFKGKNDGTFGPNDDLTRGQMAAVLVKAFNLQGTYPMAFKDIPSNFWAHDVISKLAASEVTNGYSDMTFRPNNDTTRAEMAVFIYNAMNKSVFHESDLSKYASTQNFGVKNGVLYFKNAVKKKGDAPIKDYIPNSPINPTLNREVYLVAKTLIDNKHYVDIEHESNDGYNPEDIAVTFGPTMLAATVGNFTFGYNFKIDRYSVIKAYKDPIHATGLETLSNKIFLSMGINTYWFDSKYITVNEEKQKLKDSLIAIFGDKGTDVYNNIENMRVWSLTHTPNGVGSSINKQAKVDNINIYYNLDSNGTLYIDFAYAN